MDNIRLIIVLLKRARHFLATHGRSEQFTHFSQNENCGISNPVRVILVLAVKLDCLVEIVTEFQVPIWGWSFWYLHLVPIRLCVSIAQQGNNAPAGPRPFCI